MGRESIGTNCYHFRKESFGVKLVKAIILAAGISKRLRPITSDKPKCLLKLNGITILDYQLQSLAKLHVDQILIVIGYKRDAILDYVKKSHYSNLITTIYNSAFERMDNASSVALALDYIDSKTDSVFIFDGDIICDCELL